MTDDMFTPEQRDKLRVPMGQFAKGIHDLADAYADLSKLLGTDTPEIELELQTVASNSLTISWEPWEAAASYEVSAVPAEGAEIIHEVAADVHAFTFAALPPKTDFYLSVIALDEDGVSLAHGSIQASTPVGPVLPPVGLIEPRTVTMTQDAVTIAWDAVTGATGYVVARDGVDREGAGAWTETTTNQQFTFLKLQASTTYQLGVSAHPDNVDTVLAVGSLKVTTMPEPKPPVVTKGRLPLVGRSGTGTNVIVFRSGVDTLADLTVWEIQNGVKVDGLMSFVDRPTEAKFLNAEFWRNMGQIAATGRVVVIAMPFAPESAGSGMNKAVAAGAYDSFHQRLSSVMLANGLNRENVVFREGWEYNGNWYAWSTTAANGGVSAYMAAYTRTMSNLQKLGLDRVIWNQCANKGPQANNSASGADVYVPGVGIVGIDHYAMWPKQTDPAGFLAAVNQVPGIASQVALAKAKGIQWSIDENGPINPTGKDFGGDNQAYAQGMIRTAKAGADGSLAYFTIYDDAGAPSTFHHELSANPVWKAAVLGWLKSAQK